VVEYGLRLSGG